jgi:hypothetical protein
MVKINFGWLRTLISLSIMLWLCAFPLMAQSFDAWLAKPENLKAYGAMEADMRAMIAELNTYSLSETLFVLRLEEASKKKVPPSLLKTTLRSDLKLYTSAAIALRTRSLLSTKLKEADASIEQAAILLRSGLTIDEISQALDAAMLKAGAKGKAAAILSRAYSALAIATTAKSKYSYPENARISLANALIMSTLTEKKFGSVMDDMAARISKGSSPDKALDEAVSKIYNVSKPSQAKDNRSNEGSGKDNEKPGNSGDAGGSDKPGNSGNAGGGDKPSNSGKKSMMH